MRTDRLRMFALGAATLMFEVLLTRIAAVTLFANLAFAVIALSLFGLAAGSAWAERATFAVEKERDRAVRFALLAAALITLVSGVLASKLPLVPTELMAHGKVVSSFTSRRSAFDADPTQAHWGLILIVVTAQFAPFALAGYAQALVFGRPEARVSSLYAFDLAGATLGSLATLALLRWFGAVDALGVVAILFVVAALGDALVTLQREQIAGALAIGASVLVLGLRPFDITYAAGFSNDSVIGTDWSALARVALMDDQRLVVDNTSVTEVAFAHDTHFDNNLERIPYLLRPEGDVLVIGAGGGQEIETALATAPGRKRHVDAIELADGEERLMRAHFGRRNDFLLGQPGVDYQIADGRSYLETSNRAWDVIQMKEVNFHSFAGQAASAWSPNLLFTVEAIRLQMSHLKERGYLAITKGIYLTNDNAGSIETIATIAAAVPELASRLVVVDRSRHSGRQRLYLVAAVPFTDAELERIETITRDTDLHLVRTPHRLAKSLEDAVNGLASARPPTDDHPFGHGGRQRSDHQMLSFGVTVFAILAVIIFVISVRRVPSPRRAIAAGQLAMCGGLGVGFMLLEVVLVERMSLVLGHPTVAFAVVLTSMLCALGAGSILSGRFEPERGRGRTIAIASITLLVVVASSFAPTDAVRTLGLPGRVLVVAIVLFFGSTPLGMLLPSAIRLARASEAATAAGAWSINAACSVLGTLAAALLVRTEGFRVTSHVTWLAYASALALWIWLADGRERERGAA